MNGKTLVQAIILGLILGAIGMVAGYAVFGKIGGEYVGLDTIFAPNKNVLENALHSVVGINAMRAKILWCGAAGGIAGIVLRFFFGVKARG